MTPEARLEDFGAGLTPADGGWFAVNIRDGEWWTSASFGAACQFETEEQSFLQLGKHVRVLRPGQPNCLYRS